MKILITPRSFGKSDEAPLRLLEKHGAEIIRNPTGAIMDREQMREAISGCDGVILGVDPLDASVLSCAGQLKAVAKYGVGTDNIDLEYCQSHGIAVSKTVGANSAAVADYAFALMLALARRVIPIDKACRQSDWSKVTTLDVSGRTLGLVGLGAIGKQMVKRAQGFGMSILAYDLFWDETYAAENSISRASVARICRECGFISLHVPYTPETRHIIGADEISLMKSDAIIINTARGGIIDEDALLRALTEKRIAGAGLDAFEQEPPANKAWFDLENVVIGSHCAASTQGAVNAMGMMSAVNLLKDLGISV